MFLRRVTGFLAAAALAAALAVPATATVSEDTPAPAGGNIRQQGDATVELDSGPGASVEDEHSFRLRIGDSDPANPAYALVSVDALTGVRLTDIDELSYWTRVETGHSAKIHGYEEAAFLYLHLDEDGDGKRDDTLVFEPTFNGDVFTDRWQYWNARNGFWHRPGSDVEFKLGSYLKHNPDAVVVSADIDEVPAGSMSALGKWDGFIGSTDGMKARMAGDDESVALYDEIQVFEATATR